MRNVLLFFLVFQVSFVYASCENPVSQFEMNTCSGQTLEVERSALNELVKNYKAGLGADQASHFEKSHETWEGELNSYCDFDTGVVSPSSVVTLIINECRLHKTTERIEELQKLASCEKDDSSCLKRINKND